MSLTVSAHTKRSRESEFLELPNKKKGRVVKVVESSLDILQKTDVATLRSQSPDPQKATQFVVHALQDITVPLPQAPNERNRINGLIAKSLQVVPSEYLDQTTLNTLVQAYAHIGLAATDLFFKCIHTNNEALAIKFLEFDLIDLEEFGVDAMGNAITFNQCDLIRALAAKKGALVYTPNEEGDLPLRLACMTDSPKIVATLVDLGADPWEFDREERNCIDYAYEVESPELLASLQKSTVQKAQSCIQESLLTIYQVKLKHLYPTTAEFDRRKILQHINSIKDDNEGYIHFEMAAKILALLKKPWPKELEALLKPGEKEGLLKFLELAAIPEGQKIYRLKEFVDMYLSGVPVGFPLGHYKHTIYIMICDGYITICNRGAGNPEGFTNLRIFAIKSLSADEAAALFQEMLEFYETEPSQEEAEEYYYRTLPLKLSAHKDRPSENITSVRLQQLLSMLKQKVGNCTYANLKLAMRVFIALKRLKDSGSPHVNLTEIAKVIQLSKTLSTHTRLQSLDEYLEEHSSFLEDPEIDQSLVEASYTKMGKHLSKTPIDTTHYPTLSEFIKEFEDEDSLPIEEINDSPFSISEMRARLSQHDQAPVTLHEIDAMVDSIDDQRLNDKDPEYVALLDPLRDELVKLRVEMLSSSANNTASEDVHELEPEETTPRTDPEDAPLTLNFEWEPTPKLRSLEELSLFIEANLPKPEAPPKEAVLGLSPMDVSS